MWTVKVTEKKKWNWSCDNHKVACLRGLKMESETNLLYMIRKTSRLHWKTLPVLVEDAERLVDLCSMLLDNCVNIYQNWVFYWCGIPYEG